MPRLSTPTKGLLWLTLGSAAFVCYTAAVLAPALELRDLPPPLAAARRLAPPRGGVLALPAAAVLVRAPGRGGGRMRGHEGDEGGA